MVRKLFPRDSIFVFTYLLLLFTTNGMASLADEKPFTLNFEQNRTQIQFQLTDPWKLKILNKSPALKIIVKIFNDAGLSADEVKLPADYPEKGAVSAWQKTPLDQQSCIVAFELKEPLAFTLDSHINLMIDDLAYFDESEKFYRTGLEYHKKEQLGDAITYYRKAVFKNRRHGNAYYKAGQVRFAWKQYRLAEINFKHAERLGCDSLGLWNSFAELYNAKGQKALADKYSEKYRESLAALQPEPAETPGIEEIPNETENLDTAADSMANLAQAQISELDSIPQNAKTAEKPIPAKVVFYLAGIAVMFLFLGLMAILYLKKRRSKPDNSYAYESDFEENLQSQKTRILEMAQQHMRKIPAAGENEIISEEPSSPDPATKTPVREKNYLSNPEDRQEPEPQNEEAGSWSEKLDMARHLNLGVGEIELALNLKAHQRHALRTISVNAEIERLYQENVGVGEIARRMKLGRGEVELILALKKNKKLQESVLE